MMKVSTPIGGLLWKCEIANVQHRATMTKAAGAARMRFVFEINIDNCGKIINGYNGCISKEWYIANE